MAPALDILAASGSAVSAAVLASNDALSFLSFDEYVPLYLAQAVAFAGSAIYGLLQTSDCRNQVEGWRAARKRFPSDESMEAPLLPTPSPALTTTTTVSTGVISSCAEALTGVQDSAHSDPCAAPRRRPFPTARALH